MYMLSAKEYLFEESTTYHHRQNGNIGVALSTVSGFVRNLASMLIYSTKGKSCYWCFSSGAHAMFSSYENLRTVSYDLMKVLNTYIYTYGLSHSHPADGKMRMTK